MNAIENKAFRGLAILFLVTAAVLFGTAGTLDYWQAWLYLAAYFAASIAITIYLVKKDPALLARRMRGGPFAEKEPAQRIIMALASLGFVMLAVVPALIWRLTNEERFLLQNLPGYREYRERVRYRLLPLIW